MYVQVCAGEQGVSSQAWYWCYSHITVYVFSHEHAQNVLARLCESMWKMHVCVCVCLDMNKA
jgi:hypothetical protein